MLDIKVDLRIEIQKIHHKMLRHEELLQDILLRLNKYPTDKLVSKGEEIKISPIASDVSTHVESILGIESSESVGGNGLGPLLLRKRRSKSKKAPAPPKKAYDQKPLLENDPSISEKMPKSNFP